MTAQQITLKIETIFLQELINELSLRLFIACYGALNAFETDVCLAIMSDLSIIINVKITARMFDELLWFA